MSPTRRTWTSPALPVGPRVPVWAPDAHTVELHLPGEERLVDMVPAPGGWWTAPFDLEPGTDYAYRVDGSPNRPDPRSALQPDGVHGHSRTVDPATWQWTDQDWEGKDLRGSVIYELHVGTFTPEGTLDAAISRLDHLAELGVDIIELMPLAAFPGKAGWGYDGVALWAVHETYGGPEALARFVDAAHSTGIGVCLDVVYNHLGPSGNYLSVFGPYFTQAHHTPWARPSTTTTTAASRCAPSSSTPPCDGCVTSTSTPCAWTPSTRSRTTPRPPTRPSRTSWPSSPTPWQRCPPSSAPPEPGGGGRPQRRRRHTPTGEQPPAKAPSLGMTAQWADDVHHALHARLTGETQGYYGDFAEAGAWAKAYGRAFLHNGTWSTFRERNWGAPVPEDTDPRRFVVFGSDHDQIGNRAVGDRPSTSLDDATLAATAALVLLSPLHADALHGRGVGNAHPLPVLHGPRGGGPGPQRQ